VVVAVTVVVIVEISSGLILIYKIRFVSLGQDITKILEIYKCNTVFLFRMSLLVYSGTTV
jgi:hypothetical protein